jgi:hypothetical protein
MARRRDAERRRDEDRQLVIRMTNQIGILFPGCPPEQWTQMAEQAARRGSGRGGRTRAGRNLEQHALIAAVTAAVHHRHTSYDQRLAQGIDRATARESVS